MTRKLNLPDGAITTNGAKLTAPSAMRNLEAIQGVLTRYLPTAGHVLEIASGTGEHIVAHAAAFPDLMWRPSDVEPLQLASISERVAEADLSNLLPPAAVDACMPGWGDTQGPVQAVILVNLLHLISEGEMAVLLDEMEKATGPGGFIAIYGPFLREGQPTSEGDATFDASLRFQDPAIGYKDLGAVASVLEALQLRVTTHAMPANNVMLVARRP